eukprot:TRINITY_DN1119_c0_g1_i1.p1 TRINITY_DN1119_c0_g1~~TRINITY_DN1119_c0_g1_i1.p1  ORF type:complete len:316 (+),score=80.42 TRINITY_DN1119_c0_g1_i1:61-1008(+)
MGDKDKKGGESSKSKTFNDLDERFQWQEGMDPDHIFPEEKEMIAELRSKIPELERESDKFIAVFLFARRHAMPEVLELLKKYYEYKDQYGFHTHPTFTYHKELEKSQLDTAIIQFKGQRDRHNRILRYYIMSQDRPSSRTVESVITMWFWQTAYMIETEPLNAWRNGIVICVDLKDMSLKNLDMSSKQKEITRAMQGVFPFRIRAMLACNGGMFLSAMISAAKLFLPKKLMSRIQVIKDNKSLFEIIPKETLMKASFGGDCPLVKEDYFTEIKATEAVLFEKGIWQIPSPTSPSAGGPQFKSDDGKEDKKGKGKK